MMINESVKKQELMGLDFFVGVDSFIQDLTEEDESVISGGRRSIDSPSINNTNTGTARRRRRRRRRGSRSNRPKRIARKFLSLDGLEFSRLSTIVG